MPNAVLTPTSNQGFIQDLNFWGEVGNEQTGVNAAQSYFYVCTIH